tara:strand:+ start:818 stop:982 length:165 start_codon:yes stop_codon:yes gene_type:complete
MILITNEAIEGLCNQVSNYSRANDLWRDNSARKKPLERNNVSAGKAYIGFREDY